ncbi:MAG: hypothetical protein ACLSVD_05800 [Eggerthellaceae bacterium]
MNRGDRHEYYAVVLGSSSKPQRFVDSQRCRLGVREPILRAPISDEDIASGLGRTRVAFTVAWFMLEGW